MIGQDGHCEACREKEMRLLLIFTADIFYRAKVVEVVEVEDLLQVWIL